MNRKQLKDELINQINKYSLVYVVEVLLEIVDTAVKNNPTDKNWKKLKVIFNAFVNTVKKIGY